MVEAGAMEAHRIEVGEGTLYVAEHGVGKAVLLGHSLLADGSMFSHQVAELSQDHRVLNVDLRGHGRSFVPDSAYDVEDLAGDYGRVLDALGVERAVIVGLSLGAMAAMQYALDEPKRVAGLVLMDTKADGDELWRRFRRRVLGVLVLCLGPRLVFFRRAAPILFGSTFRRVHRSRVEAWLERMTRLRPEAVYRAIDMLSRRRPVHERLHELDVPTLVVVGEEDEGTPLTCARVIADGIAGARLEVIASAGHLSTIEQPEATTRAIRRFLCEHDL